MRHADTGELKWFFQYTPGDYMDYDEVGVQLLVDTEINGENRKVLAHFGRNGIFYTLDRTNGSFINAAQYVTKLNWTKGIDPKTGKPVEYDPSKGLQEYAHGLVRRGEAAVQTCPHIQGGINYWPTAYDSTTGLAYGLAAALPLPALSQNLGIVPDFAIWDAPIGGPISGIPEEAKGIVACGTNGGSPSTELRQFEDFARCPAEPSGLHEVQFTYDDEQDYVAKALAVEYKVAQGGTSVDAHPVIVSVLVDAGGIVRGIRIVTDDRIAERDRRAAVTLARNLKGRFSDWNLACEDIPPEAGETAVGRQFVHEVCKGANAALGQTLVLESSYFRKRGQERLNEETQQVNRGYYVSAARLELMQTDVAP